MITPDKIPTIKSNRPFPMGDQLDLQTEKDVNEWFDTVKPMAYGDFMNKIRKASSLVALAGNAIPYGMHCGATLLCEEWDRKYGGGKELAIKGYKVSTAFKRETHCLPVSSADLRPELREMRTMGIEQVRMFAQTAWKGMEYYRYVHHKFDRLYEYSQTKFDMYSDDDKIQFRAGLVLPYMISWTGSLIDETPPYDAMINLQDQKMNLQTTDFGRFFTPVISNKPN